MTYSFCTDNERLQARHCAALEGLAANVATVAAYDKPVLIEGAEYQGIWLECGPLEGLCYAPIDAEAAVNNHRVFFALQRDDGYLPCFVRRGDVGTGQIQSVVPIAATAWELFQRTGDREFLADAYDACSKWDDWLVRYRDTRGTGLTELFCEYDTGHDNSPRIADIPHQCPSGDARICADMSNLPWIAPDLSATLYGGRISLAAMADELGLASDAARWRSAAELTRRSLLAYCYCPEDAAFYDLDSSNRWVRIVGDAITRVLGEHVVDQALFDEIFRRQIYNPAAFWTAYPLPSIAVDDPAFVGDIPRNSWGGAAQALTALRTSRWFDRYGKYAEHAHLMRQWVAALALDSGFYQQMSPFTGAFTHADGAGGSYSPAMLVLIEFVARLYGVMWYPDRIEWNVRLPEGATTSRHEVASPAGLLAIQNDRGMATLSIDGKVVATVSGTCRIVTDHKGTPTAAIGTEPAVVCISVGDQTFSLHTNQLVPFEK